MFYNNSNAEVIAEGVWDEKSCIRRVGGYDIDKSNLPADMKYLPKGAVMAFATATGKAKLLKSVTVYAEAASSSTTVKIKKNNAIKVGDTIGTIGAISAIDKSNADYDTVTVSALSAKVNANTVLTETVGTILGLNYATVKLDDAPSCSVTLQAYEIEEDSLPYAITAGVKTALTDRHAFKI